MRETTKGEGATIQHEIVNASQQILSEYFDTAIRLEKLAVYQTNKSVVIRCRVIDPKSYVPPTFIIKHVVSSEAELVANWIAAQFLSQISNGLTVTHRFYGGDLNQKFIVLEDLGTDDETCTQNLVYGNDPIAAQNALIEHTTLIGQLHALTVGKYHEYQQIQNDLKSSSETNALFANPWPSARLFPSPSAEIHSVIQLYEQQYRTINLQPHHGFEEEIARVVDLVEDNPRQFLVFCQGDQNGPGSSLRCGSKQKLYDFDCGGFRHALLEGMPGQTTWGCFMRLPAEILADLEVAYRTEVAKSIPDTADNDLFYPSFVVATARWYIFHVLSRLQDCLVADAPRGPTTRRQQYLAWLDAFATMTQQFSYLQALGNSSRDMATQLRKIWPETVHNLPYYPAFC